MPHPDYKPIKIGSTWHYQWRGMVYPFWIKGASDTGEHFCLSCVHQEHDRTAGCTLTDEGLICVFSTTDTQRYLNMYVPRGCEK